MRDLCCCASGYYTVYNNAEGVFILPQEEQPWISLFKTFFKRNWRPMSIVMRIPTCRRTMRKKPRHSVPLFTCRLMHPRGIESSRQHRQLSQHYLILLSIPMWQSKPHFRDISKHLGDGTQHMSSMDRSLNNRRSTYGHSIETSC